MTRIPLLAGAMAAALTVTAEAATFDDPFTGLVVFGDSLSDPGNVFAATGGLYPSAPYFNGRFSDGPTYADHLAADFDADGKPVANFAFGGARAVATTQTPIDLPDFDGQRMLFAALPDDALGADPLGLVFFGGNDLFSAINGNGGNADATLTDARAAATALADQIALFDAGTVDTFAIFTLADLGAVPRYAAMSFPNADGTPDPNPLYPLRDLATAATSAFNAQLGVEAARLRGAGLTIVEIPSAATIAALLANPTAFGITETMVPCGVPAGSTLGFSQYAFDRTGCDLDDVTYAWWDAVHPTTRVHAALADLTRATLSPSVTPVPLPLPATGLGAALVLLVALRRRAA